MPDVAIAKLETIDRAALLALWSDVFASPAPKRLSMPFLRRFLAFELQARRYGGPSPALQKKLQVVADGKTRKKSSALRPGGRLIREWNGITHVVDVTESGFAWRGREYRSLSAIARAITGAHWSGPRFFGLKGAAAR